MIIQQVLNNNCAIVKSHEQEELIVTGKGIAFKKKKGDTLERQRVEKIFRLENENMKQNLTFLIKDVPIKYILTSFEVVSTVQKHFNLTFQDYLYVTLADHLYAAQHRIENNLWQETVIPDMQSHYPLEMEASELGLKIINQNLAPSFPQSEIVSLALHFLNAKLDVNTAQIEDNARFIRIINFVNQFLNDHQIVRTQRNHYHYDRFFTHMSYFYESQNANKDENQLSSIDVAIFSGLKQSHPVSYKLANELAEALENQFQLTILETDKYHFQLHLERLI